MTEEKKKLLIIELKKYMQEVRNGLKLSAKMEELKEEMERGEYYEGYHVPPN